MVSRETLLRLGETGESVETNQGLKLNTRIGDSPYLIQKILSRGEWTITYLTKHSVTKTRFVVKEFFPVASFGMDDVAIDLIRRGSSLGIKTDGMEKTMVFNRYKADFLHNSHQLIRLQHLNFVVPVVDAFEANNTVYRVMSYVPYPNLATVLKHELLKPGEALDIFHGILDSVQKLHELKVVHKTLSPGKLFITDQKVLLGDFQMRDLGSLTHQKHESLFVAPEVKSRGSVDHRSDLYSLGRILEYLLEHIGYRPNDQNLHLGPTFHQDKVGDVLKKSLEPAPKDRLASVADMAQGVERLVTEDQGGKASSQWLLVFAMVVLAVILFLGMRSFLPKEDLDKDLDTGSKTRELLWLNDRLYG